MAFNANKYRSDYQKNKYDRVVLYLPKGEKQKWQEAATKAGMSLNAFIVDSASANIENGFCPERTAPNIPSVPTSSALDDKEALYAERNRQMDELAAQFSTTGSQKTWTKRKTTFLLSLEYKIPCRISARKSRRRWPICVLF